MFRYFRYLAVALGLFAFGALGMGAGFVLAQSSAPGVALIGPLQKAWLDPTTGIAKSPDLQWAPESPTSSDTFTSLNDYLGDAIDGVTYSRDQSLLSFSHVDGRSQAINIAGPGGSVATIGYAEVGFEGDSVSLEFGVDSASQLQSVVIPPPNTVAGRPGVMSAGDKSALDAAVTKLAGIDSGAERNVNADWNAVAGAARILNKPTSIGGGTTVVANPPGDGGDVLSRIEIDAIDYVLPRGEQGPQGNYTARIYIVAPTDTPPATPEGGIINVENAQITPPGTWHAEPVETPVPTDNSLYVSVYKVNPAVQTGNIVPVWSAPFVAGTHGPAGAQGASGISTQPIFTESGTTPGKPAVSIGTDGGFILPSGWSVSSPSSPTSLVWVSFVKYREGTGGTIPSSDVSEPVRLTGPQGAEAHQVAVRAKHYPQVFANAPAIRGNHAILLTEARQDLLFDPFQSNPINRLQILERNTSTVLHNIAWSYSFDDWLIDYEINATEAQAIGLTGSNEFMELQVQFRNSTGVVARSNWMGVPIGDEAPFPAIQGDITRVEGAITRVQQIAADNGIAIRTLQSEDITLARDIQVNRDATQANAAAIANQALSSEQEAELAGFRIAPATVSRAGLAGDFILSHSDISGVGSEVWARLEIGAWTPPRVRLNTSGGTYRFTLDSATATTITTTDNLPAGSVHLPVRVNLYPTQTATTGLATIRLLLGISR